MAPSPIVFPPFLDFLNDQETLLAFLATIVLVLLTGIWLSWSPRKGGSDERTVILVGPSGAGKTSIFSQLTHSTHPPTTASLLPSTTHFLLPPPSYLAGQTYNKVGPPPRKLKIIDYPGHPRLAQGLKELIVTEIVKGGGSVSEGGKKGGVSVVFVVDGSGREKDVGGVVE
ncbi:hypothetical protein BDY24DRAFT_397382 [Mrakia frigida]|uniref:uncharacterized protein n=1 Tax=Mrakia frigida TaxID=29902 RepID=UPI003FCC0304